MARAKTESDGDISMMDMVREALGVLGMDAKPLAIQSHIKDKYGKELTTQIISNYKFQARKEGGVSGSRGSGGAGALRIEDFEAVRGLVHRLGAEQVKRMVDVVG